MLEVKEISKNFGEFKAIDQLSFNVKIGDVMGFLGPNGAGKTTSMRVITGYLNSDHGSIKINNRDINVDPIYTKSTIGYLPEGVPLYLDFSPYLYLDYVCQVREIKNSKNAIKKVISDLQLEDVKDVPIETLSKGFKRRVGIAQALIHNPKLLILDEPTDGLDPLQKFEVRKLIKKLSKTKAIIISTHILDEVPEVCNKCLIINNSNPQLEEALGYWFNNGTDIEVEVDGNTFTQQDFQIIQQLNAIIKNSGQVGEFKIGNIFVRINVLQERQNELIHI